MLVIIEKLSASQRSINCKVSLLFAVYISLIEIGGRYHNCTCVQLSDLLVLGEKLEEKIDPTTQKALSPAIEC